MVDLSDAYVLGVMAEAERQGPKAHDALVRAQQRAQAIMAELDHAVQRLAEAECAATGQAEARENMVRAVTAINARVAKIHDEISTFKKKSIELQKAIEHADPSVAPSLRRQRGRLLEQIEQHTGALRELGQEVDGHRKAYQTSYDTLVAAQDRQRVLAKEVKILQSKLPEPVLYLRDFEWAMARANCALYLNDDGPAWCATVHVAIDPIVALHRAIRAGRYRLDKHSDVVGGRAWATAEAVCAAIAIGKTDVAVDLFATATDANLFFHHIYSVFRVWCAGLYLTEQWSALHDLASLHRYADGERGALAQAYLALMARDGDGLRMAISDLARYDWWAARDPKMIRGLGVVDVNVAALIRLAHQANMPIENPGATLPAGLYRLL